ncbi:hypothetical protein IJ732_05860, partial [bacterium]|nr:hypothetical protein [bacterium]
LINNCTAYDNGECSQCENGYQNNGTSCRDIRENTCDTYSGTTCTKCTTDNLLVDNECVSKTSLHCQTSDGVSCTECENTNLLANGVCVDANTQNCEETDGVSTCTKCSYDYKLSGSSCVEMTMDEKNAERLATCKSNNSASCTLANNTVLTRYGTKYTTYSNGSIQGKWDEDGELASNACIAKGMHLMTIEEYQNFRENGLGKGFFWVEGNKITDYNSNDSSSTITPYAEMGYAGAQVLCVEND